MNKKEYIKELCAQVYGYTPREVVAYQETFTIEITSAYSAVPANGLDLKEPVFIESYHFGHSKKVSGMENFIAFGVLRPTSKTMQVFSDCKMEMLCKYLKITSSEAGECDITITGYKCI